MRRVCFGSLILLGVLFVTCEPALVQDANTQSAPVQMITISAKKYDFDPNEIRVPKGTKVELRVHSEDVTHGVKIDVFPEGTKDKSMPGLMFDDSKSNGKVEKKSDQVLDFVAEQPGTYDFKCAKLCGLKHDRMKGKLIVE